MPPPRNQHLQRDAEIIEYWVNNPGLTSIYIAEKYNVSTMQLSRVLDKYFPYVFGRHIVLNSGIDTDKAIQQEREITLKETPITL